MSDFRQPGGRGDYPFLIPIQTRWSDNDMFGHVNNVQYYRYFEMAVVDFLRGPCAFDLFAGPMMTFAAESLCRFRRPLSWPQPVTAGLRIEHIGRTSFRYGFALFEGDADELAADGHWVHVLVDRHTQRPVPIPDELKAVLVRYSAT